MRKYAIAGTLSLVFAGALGAQEPRPQNPQTPPSTPSTTAQSAEKKLTGCLYREDQVPGRKPNVAERAGVMEDYILVENTAAGATTPSATGTSGSTASGASGKMYKVEGPADEKLKALVGKRVEVMGRVNPEAGAKPGQATPDRNIGPDQVSLSEINATSIREVSGTCPTAPAGGK